MIKRIGVVTPYFKEPQSTILACIDSVKKQAFASETKKAEIHHYLVSDGFPQSWIDTAGIRRHMVLDFPHKDMGNTPLTLGAMQAIADGCDAIYFLDADCYLDPGHMAACLETAENNPGIDFVVCKRRFVNLGGEIVPIEEEPVEQHVDRNCFFLLPGAFHTISQYMMQGPVLAKICDRVYYGLLVYQKLKFAVNGPTTLNYVSNWNGEYLKAGEMPPPEAKSHYDMSEIVNWWKALSPAEKHKVHQKLGFPLDMERPLGWLPKV
ncbi:MAG: glycosyltransferase family A protein [Alphaproteobacteria bacterium]|nr:glycosyltransferase family A protein [Alphaproteobacteria bacterium]